MLLAIICVTYWGMVGGAKKLDDVVLSTSPEAEIATNSFVLISTEIRRTNFSDKNEEGEKGARQNVESSSEDGDYDFDYDDEVARERARRGVFRPYKTGKVGLGNHILQLHLL